MLVNVTPIRSEEGEIVSVVVTMQDLAPLEELERMRAEFLGLVSHELRAPLTSIKGSASTVLDAEPLPSQAEMVQFFRIIGGQADQMRGLISNLLDAGSIEAGTLTVQPESSDLAVLVERARNTFVSGVGRQPVRIDLPPDLPRVMADRERIVQVLNNLLSNAGRHSPPSSAIGVEAAREGSCVAVSVTDRGRGISPERLGHLFRKRASPSEGTGLGLAISKGLVEAHGGRIRAESAGTGQGARFTFTIPAAGEAAPEAATPRGWPRPGAGRATRGRILVVDDDPHTLRYVRDVLSDAGYAPVATGNPDEIPAIIRAERPHLVLLDLVLPGADGIELMEQLPELADLPVIFISVYGRDETIARALAGGAADYVVKPFSPTELVARVQAALRVRARPETLVHGELAVDFGQRRVTIGGREVQLTTIQLELVRVLSAAGGRVVTTEALLRKVWGRRGSGDTDRLRTAMRKLRRKLGDDAADPTYIFNEYGVGYRFARPGPP